MDARNGDTRQYVHVHAGALVGVGRREQAADNELTISVTNLAGGADSCLAARVGSTAANTVRVLISLSSNQMLAPGMYELGNGWEASYARADGACTTAEQVVAVKGILQIDSVDVRSVASPT